MTGVSVRPNRATVLGLSLLVLVAAGGAAALGASGIVVAIVASAAIAAAALWVSSLERMVNLIFVGAMLSKLIAILSGLTYFPVVFDAALALSVGAALLRTSREGWSIPVSAVAGVAWAVFFVTAIAQVFNPNVPSALAAAQGFRVTAFQSLAFWLGLRAFRSHSELQTLFKWILGVGLVVLANGLRQLVWPLPFDAQFVEAARSGPEVFQLTAQGLGQRAFSIFPSPFTLGYFGTLVAILAAYLAKATGLPRYWAASLAAALGAVASLTRSTVFSLIAGLTVFLVVSEPGYVRRLLRVAVALAILAGVVSLLGRLLQPIGFLLAVSRSPLTEPHFIERLAIWGEVWPVIWKQPFLGYGVGSAGDALGDLYFGTDSFHVVPHNVMLKLLLELGVVGTVAFTVTVAAAAGRALASLGQGRDVRLVAAAVLGSVTAILVQGITGSAIEAYPTNLYFWFLLGVAARLGPTALPTSADVRGALEPTSADPAPPTSSGSE